MGKVTRRVILGSGAAAAGAGLVEYNLKLAPGEAPRDASESPTAKDIINANKFTIPVYSPKLTPENLAPQLNEDKFSYAVKADKGNAAIILRNRYDQLVETGEGSKKIYILNPDFGVKHIQGGPRDALDADPSDKVGDKAYKGFRSLVRRVASGGKDGSHFNELYLGRDVLFAFDKFKVERVGDNLEIRLIHNGGAAQDDKPYESRLVLEHQFTKQGRGAIQRFGVLDQECKVSLHDEKLGTVKQWEDFLQQAFKDSYRRKEDLSAAPHAPDPDTHAPSTPNPRDPKVVYEQAMEEYRNQKAEAAPASAPAAPAQTQDLTPDQLASKEVYEQVEAAVKAYNEEPLLVMQNARKAIQQHDGFREFIKPYKLSAFNFPSR